MFCNLYPPPPPLLPPTGTAGPGGEAADEERALLLDGVERGPQRGEPGRSVSQCFEAFPQRTMLFRSETCKRLGSLPPVTRMTNGKATKE